MTSCFHRLILLLALATAALAASTGSPEVAVRGDAVVVRLPQTAGARLLLERMDDKGNTVGEAVELVTADTLAQLQATILQEMARLNDTILRVEQTASDTAVALADDILTLFGTKADTNRVPTTQTIQDTVTGMLGQDNQLQAALDAKLDAANRYVDADVAEVVADLLTSPAGPSNPLRTILDNTHRRIVALENITGVACGGECDAGTYLSQPCDEAAGVPNTCSPCEAGTFSYGGLPDSCSPCFDCTIGGVDHYAAVPCSPTSNAICHPCTDCKPGEEEVAPCTATSNRVCRTCTKCTAGSTYASVPCTPTADRVCLACTSCGAGLEVGKACSVNSNTICIPQRIGFRAHLTETIPVSTNGFANTASKWIVDTNDYPSAFQFGSGFNNGIFKAPDRGVYWACVSIRLDNAAGNYVRLAPYFNGGTEYHQLSNLLGPVGFNYYGLGVSGALHFDTTDQIDMKLFVHEIGSYNIHMESSWTLFRINGVTEGMAVSITTVATDRSGAGWSVINSWDYLGRYQFALPSANVLSNGESYVAQSAGLFMVAASVRVDYVDGPYSRVGIRVDNDATPAFSAVYYSPPSRYATIYTHGVLKLEKDQRVSVAYESTDDGDWVLSFASAFSVVKLPTSLGFTADKIAATGFAPNSWDPVGGWRVTGLPHVFDTTTNAFNAETGIFTAPVNGVYFASANIRLVNAAVAYVRCWIVTDRDIGHVRYSGLGLIRGGESVPLPSSFTVSPSGFLRLKAGDKVWVVAFTITDMNVQVDEESSFSIALVQDEP